VQRVRVSIFIKGQFPHLATNHQKINELQDLENVKFYIIRMPEQCNRQIYNAENDFRLAKKMVREIPSLRDRNRQRIAHM
jgi:hypothetical protein